VCFLKEIIVAKSLNLVIAEVPSLKGDPSSVEMQDFGAAILMMTKNSEMEISERHQGAVRELMHAYMKEVGWRGNARDFTEACVIATWINSLSSEPLNTQVA
jgi:hypothetical protein